MENQNTQQNQGAIVTDALQMVRNAAVGTQEARDDLIRQLREQRKLERGGVEVQEQPKQAEPADSTQLEGDDSQSVEVVDPGHSADAQKSSRRSIDDSTFDELTIQLDDGSTVTLSKDDLKKGAGLYNKNNEKAEQLAEEKRKLAAEKAEIVRKSAEAFETSNRLLEADMQRLDTVDGYLAYAIKNNYSTIILQDASGKRSEVQVDSLQRERQQLLLKTDVLKRDADKHRKLIEDTRNQYVAAQDEVLDKKNPDLKNRRKDVASYLSKKIGFSEAEANQLVYADARLLEMADKAMRLDNALSSKPKPKKVETNTHTISKTSRSVGHEPSQQGADLWGEIDAARRSGNQVRLRELLRQQRGYELRGG